MPFKPPARVRSGKRRNSADRPTNVNGIGPRVLERDDGSLVVPSETMEWMKLDAQRRAAVTAVPDYPLYYVPGLPDGVADPLTSGYRGLGWAKLRRWREQVPLLCMIHARRARTIEAHAKIWSGRRGDVGFRVCHPSEFRAGEVVHPHIKRFIRQAEELLRSPAPGTRYDSLRAVCPPLNEDLLTINRAAIEVLPSRHDEGLVAGFRPVDGGIILERAEYIRHWLKQQTDTSLRQYLDQPDDPRVAERVSEAVQQNLVGKEYVLVRSGIVEGTYSPGRILVESLQRRTDIAYTPYQPSCVEEAMECIARAWAVWDSESRMFREGVWADTILFFSGNVTPSDYQEILQSFREGGQGYHRRGKPLSVRGLQDSDVKMVRLKDPPNDMLFVNAYVIACNHVSAIYSIDPSSIYMRPFDTRSAGLNERDRSEEIESSSSDGHKVDLHALAAMFTRLIRTVVHPELEVRIEFGEYDAMSEARLHDVLVKSTHSRNEMRVARGDAARGFYLTAEEYADASDEDQKRHDQNPWNYPDSQTFMAQAQALQQAAAPADAADGMPDMERQPGPKAPETGGKPVAKAPAAPAAPKPPRVADDTMSKGQRVFAPLPVDDWQTYEGW